jgi:hypothetical protein
LRVKGCSGSVEERWKTISIAFFESVTTSVDLQIWPDEIEIMKSAYEAALLHAGFTDRELIAKWIVNVTATGERDANEIMERALNALGVRRTAA